MFLPRPLPALGMPCSFVQSSLDRLRQLCGDRMDVCISFRGKRAGVHMLDLAVVRDRRRRTLLGEEPGELALERIADTVTVAGGKAVQYEFLDVQLDRAFGTIGSARVDGWRR